MSAEIVAILKDRDLKAIHMDALGKQARKDPCRVCSPKFSFPSCLP